jgi:hypothetical protein
VARDVLSPRLLSSSRATSLTLADILARIEQQAVGAGFLQERGVLAGAARWLQENKLSLALLPLVNAIARDVGKE